MPWEKFTIAGRKETIVGAAVVARGTGSTGGTVSLTLTFRPHLFEEPPPWLKTGEKVDVLRGTGPESGLVRIQPGGMLALRSGKWGHNESKTVFVRLPAFPGIVRSKAISADFDHSGSWIDVTIPEQVVPRGGTAIAEFPSRTVPAAPVEKSRAPSETPPSKKAPIIPVGLPVEASLSAIIDWGKANSVALSPGWPASTTIAMINTMRRRKNLPPFLLKERA